MKSLNWRDPKVHKTLRTVGIWVAVGIAYVLLGIDDWSRDWVEHEATLRFEPTNRHVARMMATPLGHPDHVPPAHWSRAVEWAGKRIKNLRLDSTIDDGETTILHFVRTHRLLRIKDDVTVYIRPSEGGYMIETHSAARLGVGDLGRNPRTIRRLYAELEDVVAESNLISAIGF